MSAHENDSGGAEKPQLKMKDLEADEGPEEESDG